MTAYTSTLTWDEVVWVVRQTLGKPDSIRAGEKLLAFPNLRYVSASEDVIRSAQGLMAEYDLAPGDAIHVAAALSRHVDTLVSEDPDLDVVRKVTREDPDSFARRRA